LKIQLKIGQGKFADPFLGRIYEEKGHILKQVGGADDINNKARALQCFNSSDAVMNKSGDLSRQELVTNMIASLSMDQVVMKEFLTLGSKFDL
jgi:hypothetical protein